MDQGGRDLSLEDLCREVVAVLRARGETLATAESLTGGLVCARVVDVPGASAVVRGGVVAYATDLKHALLGVDADLLARQGAVHPDVAAQLADGARRSLGATYGLGTTGVAGPHPQDGVPAGTVFVAVAGPRGTVVRALVIEGDRMTVRTAAVREVLSLLVTHVAAGDLPASGGDAR